MSHSHGCPCIHCSNAEEREERLQEIREEVLKNEQEAIYRETPEPKVLFTQERSK